MHSQFCATNTSVELRSISITPKGNPVPISSAPQPLLEPLVTTLLLASMDLPVPSILFQWRPFVFGSLPSAQCSCVGWAQGAPPLATDPSGLRLLLGVSQP